MEEIRRAEELEQALVRYTNAFPSTLYNPHDRGQLQFHLARHMIRGLFPGNGFGKTTAAIAEANDLCTHGYRWGYGVTWPASVIWFAQIFDQFELLKPQIDEEIIGDQAVWNASKHRYEYPNGSQIWVVSCDRKWTAVQGINPDLVIFDEQPKLSIWREMLMRRRGKRKTRYVFAATATQGMSWMYDEVYLPWLEHHKELSLDSDAALEIQSHPRIWCWPKGGIDDNPGADAEDREHYHTTTWSSEKEKKVRLHGGFEDWTGDPVFNPEAIEFLRSQIPSLRERQDRFRSGMLMGKRGKEAA